MSKDKNKMQISGTGEVNGKKSLSNEQLMAYLDGKLNATEQREVELYINEGGFESDAIEGLKQLSIQETKLSVSRINHKLKKSFYRRHSKRKKLKMEIITYTALLVMILLIIIAYFVIRKAVR